MGQNCCIVMMGGARRPHPSNDSSRLRSEKKQRVSAVRVVRVHLNEIFALGVTNISFDFSWLGIQCWFFFVRWPAPKIPAIN